MYSRYLPDGRGGYERRTVTQPPQEPPQRLGPGPGPPPQEPFHRPPEAPHRPPEAPHHPPSRPPGGPPMGPGGLPGYLGGLLRGLDTEDFLVLAVLLLARKQDGASTAELLITAALYLMMG